MTMTDTAIRALLADVSTIAVVGASTNSSKVAGRVPELLIDAGFRVIPVHPSAKEIFGQRAYPTLAEVPEHVDVVDVFRPSEEAADVAAQAVAIGAGALWLQLGIASPEARRIAQEAGMDYVEDLCMPATVKRLGIRR